MAPTDAPAGPTSLEGRALGPDLARGFMLLGIALANSHYFLSGDRVFGGFPQDGGPLDRATAWLIATTVDGRAFPMFGFLFGYGVAQIVRRQTENGATPRQVRRVLWRRSAVLIVVGFCHAVLLYAGDILAAYGVLLLVGAWTVRWRTGWLWAVALAFLVLNALPSELTFAVSSDQPDPATALPTNLVEMVTGRAVVSAFVATLGPVGFAAPFLIGLWAGRRRILERPGQFRRLLGWTAVLGIGVAWLGAQPAALIQLGVTDTPSRETLLLFGSLHDTTGVLGGLGYAAALTLLADRLSDRRGRVVTAVQAVGQRSMTCYLAQSVVWTVAFTPALLDLSDRLSSATVALLAVGTWLATVALAEAMRRHGRRGPFESLIRRVTYRKSRERWAATAGAVRG